MCLIVLALIFLIGLSINTKSNAATITLEQIVEKINSSKDVAKFQEDDITVTATCTANTITMDFNCISIDGTPKTFTTIFTLEDNILSAETPDGSNFQILMNALGQLHGYEDGEIFATLMNCAYRDEYRSCTLDNEGFEYDEQENVIRINIDKIMPLEQFTNTIFDMSDYAKLCDDEWKTPVMRKDDMIWSDGYMFISQSNDKESLYKNILFCLELQYERFKPEGITLEELTTYFKTYYPDLSQGSKNFKGIEILVCSAKEAGELSNDALYKLSRSYGCDIHGDALYVYFKVDFDEVKQGIANPSLVVPETPEKPDDPTNPGNPGTPEEPGVEPDPGTGDGNGSGDGSGNGNGSGNGTGSGDASGNLIKYPNAGIENASLIFILTILILGCSFVIGIMSIPKKQK